MAGAEPEQQHHHHHPCSICMAPSEAHRGCAACAHAFCRACLSGHVRAKLCRAALPPGVSERWCAALCESLFLGARRTYCPFPDCSEMMVADDGAEGCAVRERDPVRVPGVQAALLRAVARRRDLRRVPRLAKGDRGREDMRLYEMAKGNKWKRCPKCQFFVMAVHTLDAGVASSFATSVGRHGGGVILVTELRWREPPPLPPPALRRQPLRHRRPPPPRAALPVGPSLPPSPAAATFLPSRAASGRSKMRRWAELSDLSDDDSPAVATPSTYRDAVCLGPRMAVASPSSLPIAGSPARVVAGPDPGPSRRTPPRSAGRTGRAHLPDTNSQPRPSPPRTRRSGAAPPQCWSPSPGASAPRTTASPPSAHQTRMAGSMQPRHPAGLWSQHAGGARRRGVEHQPWRFFTAGRRPGSPRTPRGSREGTPDRFIPSPSVNVGEMPDAPADTNIEADLPPGHPSLRPRGLPCFLARDDTINSEETRLSLPFVAQVGDASCIAVEEARSAVLSIAGVEEDDIIFRNLSPYMRQKKVLAYEVLIHLRSVADFSPHSPSTSPSLSSLDGDNGHGDDPDRGYGETRGMGPVL
ncbi:hypothetical protein BAE44_0010228 [Dichanthelium oligosanthes]|uniref:RING-type domain-containing protein n=1 Tax=Dichanthelium oligosanthes TaxID=888268 RepID=A0A1E5VUE5_9POAL|nr:hypothetical protein BAE44_0010228 [Dichanthelium oligosanthes]